MATTIEVLAAVLMAAAVGILELCVLTDRAAPDSKRYLWYLPPSLLAFATAVAIAVPGVPNMLCGLLCLGTVTAMLACGLHEENFGANTRHRGVMTAATICILFGAMCWCVGY